MNKKILVTSALPYANGSIHIGHMVEYIQTDIWVRFQKMLGNHCLYICGCDCHGTPVMLRAQQENIEPEVLVKRMHQEQSKDFEDFHINFDNYYLTHSPENRELSNLIYERLNKRGDIIKKTIKQAYDAEQNMFLPDRFVKGECPKCGAKDQYGDSCEKCGATYSPADLINPISVISKTKPITKESEHFFFQLPHYETALKEWIHHGHLQTEVANKLDEWFEQGLQDWDISRDAPYFGFEIPGHPGKFFYVWLDAPIGYLASLKNLCDKDKNLNFDDYWKPDSTIDLYHFIGKDVLYFHTLFWPAILMGSNFRTPSAVYVHGFLTVNGEKMSKSRGTFINARKYFDYLDPEYLRYYFASKLTNSIEDIDLNFEDFRLKVNSDLVGKVVNIASRSAKFINQYFNNQLSDHLPESDLLNEFIQSNDAIAKFYENREYSQAIRCIMNLADLANQYIDDKKPWQLIKEKDNEKQVQEICSVSLNLFRLLILYLKPVLPQLAQKTENFLNIAPLTWSDVSNLLKNHQINVFEPMMQRVEQDSIDKILKG